MMLENLVAFFRRSFGQIGASGEAARNRLQLVLVHDRSGLSNDNLNLMKNDLVEVISKYLTIDQDSLEVEVQRSGDSVILVTNIQIAGIERGPIKTDPQDPIDLEAESILPVPDHEEEDASVSMKSPE